MRTLRLLVVLVCVLMLATACGEDTPDAVGNNGIGGGVGIDGDDTDDAGDDTEGIDDVVDDDDNTDDDIGDDVVEDDDTEAGDDSFRDDDADDTTDDDSIAVGVWADSATGLEWQILPTGGKTRWQPGYDNCETLNLGGYDDWRLPTISELRSLIRGCDATITGGACGVTDECSATPCQDLVCNCSPPGDGYQAWPAELAGDVGQYWSSSSVTDGVPGRVWYVDFGSGTISNFTINSGDRYLLYTRCVRG